MRDLSLACPDVVVSDLHYGSHISFDTLVGVAGHCGAGRTSRDIPVPGALTAAIDTIVRLCAERGSSQERNYGGLSARPNQDLDLHTTLKTRLSSAWFSSIPKGGASF